MGILCRKCKKQVKLSDKALSQMLEARIPMIACDRCVPLAHVHGIPGQLKKDDIKFPIRLKDGSLEGTHETDFD